MPDNGWTTRTTAFTLTHTGGRWLLVSQRREGVTTWEVPGGHVELGETPAQAAVRETLEETGVEVRVGRLLAVAAHEWVERRQRRDAHFYLAEPLRPSGPVPRPVDPVGEVAWLRPGALDRDTTSRFVWPLLTAWPALLDEAHPVLRYRLHHVLGDDGLWRPELQG